VAQAFAAGFGLVLAQPPVEVRSFPVSIFWHRRNDLDPCSRWLRDQITSVAQELMVSIAASRQV